MALEGEGERGEVQVFLGGLEFAAVLVPDADAEQYPAEDEYAGQVRAMNASLRICRPDSVP